MCRIFSSQVKNKVWKSLRSIPYLSYTRRILKNSFWDLFCPWFFPFKILFCLSHFPPFALVRSRVEKQTKHGQQICPVGHSGSTVGLGTKDKCLKHGKCAAQASASGAEFCRRTCWGRHLYRQLLLNMSLYQQETEDLPTPIFQFWKWVPLSNYVVN